MIVESLFIDIDFIQVEFGGIFLVLEDVKSQTPGFFIDRADAIQAQGICPSWFIVVAEITAWQFALQCPPERSP